MKGGVIVKIYKQSDRLNILEEFTATIERIVEDNHIDLNPPLVGFEELMSDYYMGESMLYRAAINEIMEHYNLENDIPHGEEFETVPMFQDLLLYVHRKRFPLWNRYNDFVSGIRRIIYGRKQKKQSKGQI